MVAVASPPRSGLRAGPQDPGHTAAGPRPKAGRCICPAFRQGPYLVARTSPVPRAQPCWGERSRRKLHPSVASEPPEGQGAWPTRSLGPVVHEVLRPRPPWPPPPLLHVTYGSSSQSVPAPPTDSRDPHPRKGRAAPLPLEWRIAVPSGLVRSSECGLNGGRTPLEGQALGKDRWHAVSTEAVQSN